MVLTAKSSGWPSEILRRFVRSLDPIDGNTANFSKASLCVDPNNSTTFAGMQAEVASVQPECRK
jgi:hypothetical protein